ncbi:uncharacterized protein LOC144160782 [Haemaphysalis longicornis]
MPPTCAELDKEVRLLKMAMEARFSELVNELRAELALSEEKMVSYQSELREATKSLTFLSQEYDSIKAERDGMIAESKALKAINEELRASNISLTKQVALQEQYSRMNNVEIRGVPNAEDENLPQLLADIGSKVKCTITPSDIDIVHRVPTPNSPAANNIIIRFVSRDKRNDFQKKAKKARLMSKDLGRSTEATPVFFNDQLTPRNKTLFSEALKLKKAKQWQFLLTDEGVIKVRKEPTSKVHRIVSHDDLRIIT